LFDERIKFGVEGWVKLKAFLEILLRRFIITAF